MTNVLLEKKGNIAVATINRPKALNALNSAVVADLDEMIGQIMADEEIRALVITGSGEKAFVAGADIGEQGAKEAALAHAGLTEGDVVSLSVKREYDDGRLEYEGTIYYNGVEYEFSIDGYSGAIRSWEVDSHS